MKLLRGATIALALVGVLLATGCGARHIRQAQDSFNAGATEENRLAESDDLAFSALGSNAYGSALSNYRTALTLSEKELSENRAELDKDNLTGTAWALKCLTLWRIADLEVADGLGTKTGEVAIACSKEALGQKSLGTRDRILMSALPALVEADRGRAQTTYTAASDYFTSAQEGLDRAIAGAPADHGATNYLRILYLRMLRAWRADILKLLPKPQQELLSQNEAGFYKQYCAMRPEAGTALYKQIQLEFSKAAMGLINDKRCGPRPA